MTGVPEDPSDRPTQMADYGGDGSQQQLLEHESGQNADSVAPDGAPEPWYRSRVLLALWALMVALLLTLIIYGIVELSRGGGETSDPSSTTSSTTPSRSSTTSPTTTTEPSNTESLPAESPQQTPEEAPPPPGNNSAAPGEPPRHHHHIPHTITLPHTVVTLPHGF